MTRVHPTSRRLGKVMRLDGSIAPGLSWDEETSQIVQVAERSSRWVTVFHWVYNLTLAAGILLIGWVIIVTTIAANNPEADPYPPPVKRLSAPSIASRSNVA